MDKEKRRKLTNTLLVPLLAIISGLIVAAILVLLTGIHRLMPLGFCSIPVSVVRACSAVPS